MHAQRRIATLAIASAALVAATFGAAQTADPARGRALHQAFCAICHPSGIGGDNSAGAGSPATILQAMQIVGPMSFLRGQLSASQVDDIAAYLLTFYGPQGGPRATVVEFYHAALDHYFISSLAADIEALDSGRLTGWARTGLTFNAFGTGAAIPVGATPVCRIYLPPLNGDSHFYSGSPAECAQTMARFPTFVLESDAVMHMILPDTVTGACPPRTLPVHRVWNQRVDSNHRYTTDLAVRAQMVARGYLPEGYGPSAVILCAPT